MEPPTRLEEECVSTTGAAFTLPFRDREQAAGLLACAPVAAQDAADVVAPPCDKLVLLATPIGCVSVGRNYQVFAQVGEAEVIRLLDKMG